MERLTNKNINYEYKFCKDCPYSGEPNGCNRADWDCEAYFKFTEFADRLAELEDKLESGQLVDTTPYIVEIKSEIPFKYKVIKPTIHRRNIEMCDSQESAEACLKKLEVRYANKT